MKNVCSTTVKTVCSKPATNYPQNFMNLGKIFINNFVYTPLILTLGLLFTNTSLGQGTEDFTNMPTTNATNYQARTWTGTNGVVWTALGARTDQTLNGKAICFGTANTRRVLSPTYSGGMATLTFKYVRGFTSTNTRSIEVYVNNNLIGSSITVSNTSNTVVTYSQAINVTGNVVLEIRSTGAGQVMVDDISWGIYSAVPPSLSSVSLAAALTSTYGTASASSSFVASGSNLTGSITATAQSGYQVSTDNSTFGSSVSVANNATVYVRYASNKPVGTYNTSVAVVLSSPSATDVNVTTTVVGNSISAATLTVTADNQTVITGAPVNTVTNSGSYSITGFVNGESATLVSGSVSYTTTYSTSSAAGTLGLVITPIVSGLSAANYQFLSSNGTVSVIAASSPSITVDASGISDFGTQCVNSSSSTMNFSVSGANLTSPIVITAQSGFEISTSSGAGFSASNPINLTPTGGTVSSTVIYLKFSPAAAQNYAETISISSNGSLSQFVNATGIGTNGSVTITTNTASSITHLSAITGGTGITTSCGSISAKGIVYGLTSNPTLLSLNTSEGTGTADYNSSLDLSGFNAGQIVYYRAYVTNSNGITQYGNELNFIVPTAPCSDIIISEYVEGSSNNKYIELYNPTNASINLVDYRLRSYYNGGTTYTEFVLSGSLAAYSTIVFRNTSATAFTGTSIVSGVVNFNGDDAIAIVKNGMFVDVFGQIGFDPGISWSNNGVSTVDKTLRRKFTITKGDNDGSNSFDPSIEWEQFSMDNVSDLGLYYAPTAADQTFCLLSNPTVGQIQSTGLTGLTLDWFNQLTSTSPLPTSTLISNGSYFVSQSSTGCSSSRKAVQIQLDNLNTVINPSVGDFVWTGKENNLFNNFGNWCVFDGNSFTGVASAPSSSTTIIIPAEQTCVTQQPLIGNLIQANANHVLIESGAMLSLTSGTLNIHGNYTNNGVLNGGSGTIAYVGATGNQTITKTGGETFPFMIVNKASGNIVLANNVTVSGGLTLTNGLVEVGTNNLILGSASLSGGSSASYVKTASSGVLSRNVGGTATTFPVGNGTYNPAMVTNTGTADVFTLRVIDNVTADGTGVGATTTEAVVNRTWMVNETTTGGSDVTLRLYWNGASEEVNAFSPASAFIAHYIAIAGMWDNIGFSGQGAGYFETNGITSFSPFTISSSTTFAPLPVELVSFQANCAGDNKINVSWTTASEHNASHYVVEHSRNGNEWTALAMVAAAGNSTSLLDYTYVHENANAGTNYYRLTQYDNDGVFEQFNVVSAACDNMNNTTTLSTYPNPSEGSFYISLFTEEMEGAGVITLTDAKGTVVYTQDVSIQKGNTIFHMDNLNVAPGMYYIQVTNSNTSTDIVKHSLR
jgi:hypothetical protein